MVISIPTLAERKQSGRYDNLASLPPPPQTNRVVPVLRVRGAVCANPGREIGVWRNRRSTAPWRSTRPASRRRR
eukprot:2596628-Pyramimonas_sp.AAC.1